MEYLFRGMASATMSQFIGRLVSYLFSFGYRQRIGAIFRFLEHLEKYLNFWIREAARFLCLGGIGGRSRRVIGENLKDQTH